MSAFVVVVIVVVVVVIIIDDVVVVIVVVVIQQAVRILILLHPQRAFNRVSCAFLSPPLSPLWALECQHVGKQHETQNAHYCCFM